MAGAAGQTGGDAGGGRGGVLRARLARACAARAGPAADPSLPGPLPPAPTPSFARLTAAALARSAGRSGGLPATAEAIDAQPMSLPELTESLPERALIALVDGPGGRLGVMAICPAVLAALIEVQAIGHVTGRPPDPRRPTRADAALAAEFVNAALAEMEGVAATLPAHRALTGWRYAGYLDDPRPLALLLEDGGFRTLRATLRLGAAGERRGTLLLAVPGSVEAEAPPAPLAPPAPASPAPPPSSATMCAALPPPRPGDLIRAAPVPVVGVLCRRPITLRELRTLQPGQLLSLPHGTLDGCTLETRGGQRLARARLGERGGAHALRILATAADPAGPPAPEAPVAQQASAMADSDLPAALDLALPPDLAVQDDFRPEPGPPGEILPMAVDLR